MINTATELEKSIEKMCAQFGIEKKWFKVMEAKEGMENAGHIVILKGRYLTDKEALFALNRWRMLISRFFQMRFRIKAKVVTRKNNKYITFSGMVGEAPKAD